MFSAGFWKKTVERCIRAAASSALSVQITGTALNVRGLDWANVAGIAAGAALVSLLVSIAATQVNDPENPSLV